VCRLQSADPAKQGRLAQASMNITYSVTQHQLEVTSTDAWDVYCMQASAQKGPASLRLLAVSAQHCLLHNTTTVVTAMALISKSTNQTCQATLFPDTQLA
jgi:hypothetical protein